MKRNPTPEDFVKEAVERTKRGDKSGWSWVYFQEMSVQDRKNFDRWIVDSKHPSAYEPGTTEDRFKRLVKEYSKNPCTGKAFTFHGSFQSLILARRRERETPGSFIHKSGDRYYVLKPKKISAPRKNVKRLSRQNPAKGVLIYGKVLKIFAEKTSGPFKGQRFVHKFKAGAIMMGMPDGSLRIMHPK